VAIDHPNPDECIRRYIDQREIKVEELVVIAGNFYSKKTQIQLVNIIAGAIYETSPGSNIVSNPSINPI